jgi:hypothetical protein
MLFLGDSTFNDADFSETVFPIEADSAAVEHRKKMSLACSVTANCRAYAREFVTATLDLSVKA